MNKRNFFKISLLGVGALAFPKPAAALEFYPTKPDKKWAVLYGTWSGSARDAGVWISEGMDGTANVFDVRENPDLSKYEYIVVGGAIRSGKVSEELQQYLQNNQAVLKNKVKGLFVVCGNRMLPPTEKQTNDLIDNHLALLCGGKGLPSKVFLGRVTYGLLDEASREMLKSANMPEYDHLKRSECLAFGKEILHLTNKK